MPFISSNTPITGPFEDQLNRTGPIVKALGMAHPSIHSHCFCVASAGSCPVWRLPSHPATFCWLCCLSGLPATASVFVFFCRALAQLFVLRDHIAIVGRAILSRANPGAGSPTPMWRVGQASCPKPGPDFMNIPSVLPSPLLHSPDLTLQA